MNELQAKVDGFLKKHGMDAGASHVGALLDGFMDDMAHGLAGQVQSLLMIPTYIGVKESVPLDKPVIVMDAGGTNFRVAVVTIHGDAAPDIAHFTKHPMPGTKGGISKEELLNTIVDYLLPVLDMSDTVGFCFSFPTEILPNRDGRLLGFNKEVKVSDSAGMLMGASLNEVLQSRGLPQKQFVLLNDTVAAMLSGVMPVAGKQYAGYIGLIYGTGTNTCYVEDAAAVTKVPGLTGSMAINMESGGWAGVPQGDYDKQLDAATDNPGDHIYEKMVSGAYQGDVVLRTVKGACAEGLFSPAFCKSIEGLESLETFEVDRFCDYPFGDGLLARAASGSDADRQTLYYICDQNFERAAKLVTVNIGGILLKTGHASDPTRPVCVVAEGTAFLKSRMFKNKLTHYIKQELNDARGVYCELVHHESATLIGTAIAGLMSETNA